MGRPSADDDSAREPGGRHSSPGRSARLQRFLGSLSPPKKIGAAILAIATALGALWGAEQAVVGVSKLVADWRRQSNPSQLARTQELGIEIWQGGKKVDLFVNGTADDYNYSRATLDAAPFELRFPGRFATPGLRVVAWTDPSVLNIAQDAPANDDTNVVFSPGHGMADTSSGSGALFLSREGFSYFIDDRVAQISGQQGAVYYNTYYNVENERGSYNRPMRELDGQHLFIVAY